MRIRSISKWLLGIVSLVGLWSFTGDMNVIQAESPTSTDTSSYTVNIPSELNIDSATSKSTLDITGNIYNKRWLSIQVASNNNFNLKGINNKEIPYTIDKKTIEIESQFTDKDSDSFVEKINITVDSSKIKYSDQYKDSLVFTFAPVTTRTIQLDCNGGTVDGQGVVKYTVKNGSSYGQLPVPVRSGYQFTAWKDDRGNTIYSGSIVELATEKLSAEWLPMRVFCLSAFINGSQNEYLQNIGTFDIYKNGKLISANRYSIWEAGIAGDVYECKNFKIKPIFKFKGIWGQNLPKGVTIDIDDDGNLISIKATLQTDSDSDFSLNFEVLSPLQELINSTKTTSLILDADKPNNIQNISIIEDMFTTPAGVYVKNNELHLYNVKDGKLIAKQDSSHLFEYIYIDKIDANNLDVSNVIDGSYMFYGCANSTEINVSQWDVSKIKYFDKMFSNCKSLSFLDVNSWNMISGYSLNNMFAYSGITDIDLSKWNTSNISDLSNLFFNCKRLKQIDLHTWNTESVKTCYWLFRGCESLEFINIDGWNTCNVYDMDRMFGECQNLITIKGLNKLNTSNVQFTRLMFISDFSLTELDLSSFDTQNCIDTSQMFRGCYNLKSIYVSDTFVMTKVSNSTQMFLDCISLIGGAGTTFVSSFIDGTAARIDGGASNPGYFTAISQKTLDTGTVLSIEGNEYIVISEKAKDTYLVIGEESLGNIQFQPNQDSNGNYYDIGTYNGNDLPSKRHDGQNSNVYEDSYIDKYLESTYYNSLPENLKKAIVTTQIKQVSYTNTGSNSKWRCLTKDTNPVSPDGTSNWFYNEGTSENPKYVRYDKVTTPDGESGLYPLKYWTKKETGYGGQAYNTITRHVYLPSIEEIGNLVDLNDANKTFAFLKGTNNSLNYMWLRDASSASPCHTLDLRCDIHSLNDDSVTNPWNGVRPAFVIDLSKVDYTEAGHIDYK